MDTIDSAFEAKKDAVSREAADYERFLQQLETDKEMRRGVALYADEAAAAMRGEAAEAAAAAAAAVGADGEEVDEEGVRLEELLLGLAVDDPEAAYGFREDEDDAKFLAGGFVPESDAVAAAATSASSPDRAAAAAAFLADPSPPKFNFL